MSEAAAYGRRIVVLAFRDAFVVAMTATLLAVDARVRAGGGTVPVLLALVAGALVTVSGFYAHEWGHYLAARIAGATPVPSRSPLSVFLFELDEATCTRRQWLAMSAGGYAASIVGVIVIAQVIDVHALSGQVAIVLTGLGVLATFALELPITYRVYRQQRA